MNDKQMSEYITFLLGCEEVKGPSLSWVQVIDDILDYMEKSAIAHTPVFLNDLVRDYMPDNIREEMLNAVFQTRYIAHIMYALSYRDSVAGVAVFMITAAAAGQTVLIHEDRTTYADVLLFRYRAMLDVDKVRAARDLWRAFLAKYLQPLEPVATELDADS